MRGAAVAGIITILLATGCSDAGFDVEDTGQASWLIINGTPDTTHQAVVRVHTSNTACTGTFIHKGGSYAHVLTAAHCVEPNPPEIVLQGNDLSDPDYFYNVVHFTKAAYDGSVNDFALVRVTGAGPATAIIPAATSVGSDTAGTPVTHVGYGLVGAQPDVSTDTRRRASASVASTTYMTMQFNAGGQGICKGDSGGPNLTTGSETVIGVNSYVGDYSCDNYSVSGRVGRVYSSFISPYLTNAPTTPVGCDDCTEAATTGAGPCIAEIHACLELLKCRNLYACIDACNGDASCKTTCANANPEGIDLYNAIYNGCVCGTECPSDCNGDAICDPVSTGGTGGTGGTGNSGGTGGTGNNGGTGNTGNNGTGNDGAGAGTTESGWVAGDNDNDNITGAYVSSCALPTGRDRHAGLLWLAALALAGGLRRRRS